MSRPASAASHHDLWRMPSGRQVIYLATTPEGLPQKMDKNTVFQGFARALLAIVLVAGVASVSACKDSGEGNAQAKAPEAEKAADAIPVEVARASRRAVAASYTGTGALDARAESQVVAKTSGLAMEVFAEE